MERNILQYFLFPYIKINSDQPLATFPCKINKFVLLFLYSYYLLQTRTSMYTRICSYYTCTRIRKYRKLRSCLNFVFDLSPLRVALVSLANCKLD